MNQIDLTIDAGKVVKPLRPFFRAFGYANVDFTYTPAFKRMYEHLSSFHNHCIYMRLHSILTTHGKGDYYVLEEGQDYGCPCTGEPSTDMAVRLNKNGGLEFDFSVVDGVYDQIIAHGMKPIVETHRMPSCLCAEGEPPRKSGYPSDYRLWREVLRAFVEHWVERYGIEEVRTWYFEVWNEPDGTAAFKEDFHRFFALYDYMVDGVHSVNESLRVGGPATMQGPTAPKMFRSFLEHCERGINYATGLTGTRLDFVSVHCKGGTPESTCPSLKVMFDSIRMYAAILEDFPEFKDVEFMNDESDIIWSGNKGQDFRSYLSFRNTHYFAGIVCKMVHQYCDIVEDELGLNLAIADSDNCHLQWEKYLFSGNRSQFTPLLKRPSADILKKPVFNAYVMMSRLRSQRLAVACDVDGYGDKFGVLPTGDDAGIALMVWNFEDGMADDVSPRRITIQVKNANLSGACKLLHYRLDSEHSSSYAAWKELGAPEPLTPGQVQAIRDAEGLELAESVQDLNVTGDIELEVGLPMHAVSLFLIVPSSDALPDTPVELVGTVEEGYAGTVQAFLKWTPCTAPDFFHYRLVRECDGKSDVLCEAPSFNTATYMDMYREPGKSYTYSVQACNASGVWSELSEPAEL